MKVFTVVGARPQFIKAAPVSRALRVRHEEMLIHTGQHYDEAMSDVFFAELGIPAPAVNLGVGSGSHGQQTGEMLQQLEALMIEHEPDCLLVYGDTNTTLAAALAASKLLIPVAHVEAGLRSFNRSMPEEINRVLTDHISSMLFCPTPAAVENLAAEGITRGVELVGDVMLDTALYHASTWPMGPVLAEFGVEPGGYYLATVHRASNTDDELALRGILEAFGALGRPVIWPVHPRSTKMLATFGLDARLAELGNIRAVSPLSYRETMALLQNARALLTDSGGMQKEAYFFGVPCVTLRDETEWVETVTVGWNTLVGCVPQAIAAAARSAVRPSERPDLYGDAHAAERVVAGLEKAFGKLTAAAVSPSCGCASG